RDVLYELAASPDPWRRRTAIVATWFFIRAGDTDDTFRICAMLLNEPHEYVQKAIGSWIRTAGQVDRPKQIEYLDKHAEEMPRISLRMATEKLPKDERAHYMEKNKR